MCVFFLIYNSQGGICLESLGTTGILLKEPGSEPALRPDMGDVRKENEKGSLSRENDATGSPTQRAGKPKAK